MVTREAQEVSHELISEEKDDKKVLVFSVAMAACIGDIILMKYNPFSNFTVLPFFILPMFFMTVVGACLLIAYLGKCTLVYSLCVS